MNNIERREPTRNLKELTMVALILLSITDTPTSHLRLSLTNNREVNLFNVLAKTFDAHSRAPVKLSQAT